MDKPHRGDTDSDYFHRYIGHTTEPEDPPCVYLEDTADPKHPIRISAIHTKPGTISRSDAEDLAQWILDTLAEYPDA